jgi:hypothetical protein
MSETDENKDVPSPQTVLRQMVQGFMPAKSLQVAAELGIADLIAEKPKTAAQLSTILGVHSESLYRLLRALASLGIFKEISHNQFENTSLSEAFRTNVPGSMKDFLIFYPDDGFLLAWTKLLDVVKTGKPSFKDANGCEQWEYFQKHRESAERFNKGISARTSQVISALLNSYDFSQFKTLIDVGGGLGTILAPILNKFPQLHGCLFEQSSVIEEAKSFLEAQGVISRCNLISGDFFESVPKDFNAYLMKSIIHDWEDEKALAILKNCRASINKHGKLLLIERVIGQDAPQSVKWGDLYMMVIYGSRVRTEQEFRNLLRASDFELKRVIALPGPDDSLIEAEPI